MEALATRKKPTATTPFTFIAFGDWQVWEKNPGIFTISDKLQPDFCLLLGDMVNDGSGDKGLVNWATPERCGGWFFKKYPCWAAIGNHEIGSGEPRNGPGRYTAYWGQPANRLFSFTYANAKFIGLPLSWPRGAALKALEEELASAKDKHVFVFGHLPYYSGGNIPTKDENTQPGIDLFKKYKVTAVFGGHTHSYYRTQRDGVHHVVNGCGGGGIVETVEPKGVLPGDVYYGQRPKGTYAFHHPDVKEDVRLKAPKYFAVVVTVEGPKVALRLVDTDGKEWDSATLAGPAAASTTPASTSAPATPATEAKPK
jgi:hypothetical protein